MFALWIRRIHAVRMLKERGYRSPAIVLSYRPLSAMCPTTQWIEILRTGAVTVNRVVCVAK